MNTSQLQKTSSQMLAAIDAAHEQHKCAVEVPLGMFEEWEKAIREFIKKPYRFDDICEYSHGDCLHTGACVSCGVFRDRDGGKKTETYLIEIGTTTRRGSFNKLFQKAVAISDPQVRTFDVRNYFENKYEGLTVKVTQIQALDISEKIIETHCRKAEDDHEDSPEMESCIRDFVIEYTESEKELHRKYQKATSDAEDALRTLHRLIKDRYHKLFYARCGGYNNNEMELVTTYNDTRCDKFPVRANLFIEAAKKAEAPNFSEPEKTQEEFIGLNDFSGEVKDDKEPSDIPF